MRLKVDEDSIRVIWFLVVIMILLVWFHIYLNNGKKKNERMQVPEGQSAAEVHLLEAVHHRATVHTRSIYFSIQAAFHAGIQYSTAKTILFFHKKNYKNYSSYHVPDPR
jgi:hypothetical protein